MKETKKNIETTDYINVTRKSNFLYSYFFLSKKKIDAITTIYAFCRRSDDIADNEELPVEKRLIELNKWKEDFIKSLTSAVDDKLLMQLKKVRNDFKIPDEPFLDMIKGMEADLTKSRYKDFQELYDYCYKAASTAGLMSIEVFGWTNPGARKYAENLGIALQLTNIIRDVKKDKDNGRIYIPEDDMLKFNYTEEDLINEKYNEKFIKLMKYESDRAKEYYIKSALFYSKKDKDLMIASRIIQSIYYSMLNKMENNNFNVFKRQEKISKFKKIWITACVYLKYKFYYTLFFNENKESIAKT